MIPWVEKDFVFFFSVAKCFILNNDKDNLCKFDVKSDERIFLGYSSSSKAYIIYNHKTSSTEEFVHVAFYESLT